MESDLRDGIFAAEGYALLIAPLLAEAMEAENADACQEKLTYAYRAATELRRQVDHLRVVISNRRGPGNAT